MGGTLLCGCLGLPGKNRTRWGLVTGDWCSRHGLTCGSKGEKPPREGRRSGTDPFRQPAHLRAHAPPAAFSGYKNAPASCLHQGVSCGLPSCPITLVMTDVGDRGPDSGEVSKLGSIKPQLSVRSSALECPESRNSGRGAALALPRVWAAEPLPRPPSSVQSRLRVTRGPAPCTPFSQGHVRTLLPLPFDKEDSTFSFVSLSCCV